MCMCVHWGAEGAFLPEGFRMPNMRLSLAIHSFRIGFLSSSAFLLVPAHEDLINKSLA